MPTDATSANHQPIDPALLRRVVREVVARLLASRAQSSTTNTHSTAVSIEATIVTAETIENITGTPSQVFVSRRAVITPAARDMARQRSLTINRSVEIPATQHPTGKRDDAHTPTNTHELPEIVDTADPSRAESLRTQLARRGVTGTDRVTLVLSDTPAKDVHHHCTALGKRASMITTITDVDRFAKELNPDVWVLDMTCVNLVAATNIAARILQLGRQT